MKIRMHIVKVIVKNEWHLFYLDRCIVANHTSIGKYCCGKDL